MLSSVGSFKRYPVILIIINERMVILFYLLDCFNFGDGQRGL